MTRYNPEEWDGEHALPKLYSRTSTGAVNTWEVWLDKAGGVVVRWGQLDGALQTTVFQCERKNVGRSNETTAVEQARLEAIAKWKKQLKKKYSETLEETKNLNIKPMLAAKFMDKRDKIVYPVDVQRKLDGVRCNAFRKDGHVILQSRGGDPYDVAHIRNDLEGRLGPDEVLDGEIYYHGMVLQDIVSLVKRPQEGSELLSYRTYDFTHLSAQDRIWSERKKELAGWYAREYERDLPDFIGMEETYEATSESEVWDYHNRFISEGYEGAIIRLRHGLYRFGYRSSDLLKLKNFDDDEFLIIGWTTGKGKFKEVPIFKCLTRDGKEFDVTPRGSDAIRKKMLAEADAHIGKQMTVRYMGFSLEGIPKIAVGVGIREPGT